MPHDELCPSSEVPNSGCLCLWIRDARADERERIAQAIEAANGDIWDPTVWDSGRMSGMDAAARIARAGGRDE